MQKNSLPFPGPGKKFAWMGVGVWTSLMLGMTLLLLTRQMGGKFLTPIPAMWFILSGVLLTAGTAATHYLLCRLYAPLFLRNISAVSLSGYVFLLWNLLLVALLAVLGYAVYLPGTAAAGIIFYWLFLITDILFFGYLLFWAAGSCEDVSGAGSADTSEAESLTKNVAVENEMLPESVSAVFPDESAEEMEAVEEEIAEERPFLWRETEMTEEVEAEEAEEEVFLPPEVTQQLSRSTSAEEDTLEGFLRMTFTPDEVRKSVHVAFCPPFRKTPRIECYAVAGEAKIEKPRNVAPHGVGVPVKKAAGCETVILYFKAWCGEEIL